jgi:hypothetical protein
MLSTPYVTTTRKNQPFNFVRVGGKRVTVHCCHIQKLRGGGTIRFRLCLYLKKLSAASMETFDFYCWKIQEKKKSLMSPINRWQDIFLSPIFLNITQIEISRPVCKRTISCVTSKGLKCKVNTDFNTRQYFNSQDITLHSISWPRSSYGSMIVKGKVTAATGRGGPKDCETSKLLHFLDNRLTDGGEAVSLTRQPPSTPSGRFLVLISVRGWVDPKTGRIRSLCPPHIPPD